MDGSDLDSWKGRILVSNSAATDKTNDCQQPEQHDESFCFAAREQFYLSHFVLPPFDALPPPSGEIQYDNSLLLGNSNTASCAFASSTSSRRADNNTVAGAQHTLFKQNVEDDRVTRKLRSEARIDESSCTGAFAFVYDNNVFTPSDLEPNNIFFGCKCAAENRKTKEEPPTGTTSNHEKLSFAKKNVSDTTQIVHPPNPSISCNSLMFRVVQNNHPANVQQQQRESGGGDGCYKTKTPARAESTFLERTLTGNFLDETCKNPNINGDFSSALNIDPNLVLFQQLAANETFDSASASSQENKTCLPSTSHSLKTEATFCKMEDFGSLNQDNASIEAQRESKKRKHGKKLRSKDVSPCFDLPQPGTESPRSRSSLTTKDNGKGTAPTTPDQEFLKWTSHIKLNTREKFPQKLYRLLEETEANGLSHVISFTESGDSFRVHDKEAFVKTIVPRYFRHQTFNSFQRQLNYYGFERVHVGSNSGTYAHPYFKRGSPGQCSAIRRVIDGEVR